MKSVYRIITVAIMLILLAVSAFATGQPTVSIEYSAGKTRFDFYRLADFSKEDGITLTKIFSGYKNELPSLDSLGSLDAEQSRILASTAEAVVIRDNITPVYSQSSDDMGKLSLTGIEKGVYLVVGQKSSDGQYVYTPSPLIVSVPYYDIHGNLQYNVSIAHNKLEKEEITETYVKYKVVKLWKDSGSKKSRPTEIDVLLYKNSEHVQTVTLNAGNNWSYEWTALDNGDYWAVIEKKVPVNYVMSVEKEQTCFYVTNTYKGPPPPDRLPSTGQLWWPVPLLIILGMISLMLGLSKGREV